MLTWIELPGYDKIEKILPIDNMAYMTYTNGQQVRKTVDKFTIEFYESKIGDITAEEFLLSIDKKMCEKIIRIMDILQEKGNQLRKPCRKYLDDGIFEIRGKVVSDIARPYISFNKELRSYLQMALLKRNRINLIQK